MDPSRPYRQEGREEETGRNGVEWSGVGYESKKGVEG